MALAATNELGMTRLQTCTMPIMRSVSGVEKSRVATIVPTLSKEKGSWHVSKRTIASTLRARTARCWPRDHWAVSVEVVVGRGGAVAATGAGSAGTGGAGTGGAGTNGVGVAGVGESWAGWTGAPPGASGAVVTAVGAGPAGTPLWAGEP